MDLNPATGKELSETKRVAGSDPRRFVPFAKIRALELLVEYPQNVSAVCRALGTSRQLWDYHLKHDPDFARSVQEIREACCDELEQTMYELGKKKSSFTFSDRIAFLRAHRPQFYDRVKVIKVEGWKMGDGEKVNRLAGLENAVDGEIVKTQLDRKQKKEYNRQQRLKAGG